MNIATVALAAAVAASGATSTSHKNLVCLSAGSIASTAVVSDEAILFYTDDGMIWRNTLQRACPGLAFENGFSEEIRGGEVCSNQQLIHVLRRGTPCFLGAFTPEPRPAKSGRQ